VLFFRLWHFVYEIDSYGKLDWMQVPGFRVHSALRSQTDLSTLSLWTNPCEISYVVEVLFVGRVNILELESSWKPVNPCFGRSLFVIAGVYAVYCLYMFEFVCGIFSSRIWYEVKRYDNTSCWRDTVMTMKTIYMGKSMHGAVWPPCLRWCYPTRRGQGTAWMCGCWCAEGLATLYVC